MMKIWLLTILCGLCFISCKTSSPQEIARAEIEEIIESVRSAYNSGDLAGIMENYHPLFLHKGNSIQNELLIWEIRLNQFPTMDYEDLQIELSGDFATADFTLFLGENIFAEPSAENGDLSYFYRTFDGWLLCGNEFIDE